MNQSEMNDGNSKTPYNSIYETLNPKNQKTVKEDVCCQHGGQCAYGRKPSSDDQYVNLPSPCIDQIIAEKLAEKLEKLKANGKENGKTPKKRGSMKEKRKKNAAFEDNYSYEVIGPPTEESTDISAPITTESIENNAKTENTAHSAYIGVCSSSDAEAQVGNRGQFALYHQFQSGGCLDNLISALPLMLVYYTTTKKHRHYPVRISGADGELYYSVDCGYPIVRKHFSLNQLVHYYKTFGAVQSSPEDCCAESFSWWLE
ncbi:unnamed protein product [Caenorhabditis brenneri]